MTELEVNVSFAIILLVMLWAIWTKCFHFSSNFYAWFVSGFEDYNGIFIKPVPLDVHFD